MADYYYNPGNALKGIAPAANAVAGIGLANAGYDLADMITKFAVAGNKIFLRRGAIQQVNALYFNSGLVLANATGVTVRLYGSDDAEHLTCSTLWYISPTDNTWVSQGGGVWKYTFNASNAGTDNPRTIIGLFRGVQFGDYPAAFLGRDTSRQALLGSVTTDARFYSVNGVANVSGCELYMYTGSNTVNPSFYFGGLAINCYGYGQVNGIWQQNVKHCSIEGLAAMGGSWRFSPTHTGANQGSNEDCEYLGCAAFANYVGLYLINQNVAVANRRLSFDNFTADFLSGPEGTISGFSEDEIGTQDGVSIRGYNESIKFAKLVSNAARHTCVQAVPDTALAPDSTFPKGISISGLSIDVRHGAYGRALGLNCDGWTITDATIVNAGIQSQLGGIGTLSRFTWDRLPYGPPEYTATNGGNDCAIFVGDNGSGATLSTAKNVKISFGVFRGAGNWVFSATNLTTQVLVLENLTIEDNSLTTGGASAFDNRKYPNQPSDVPIAVPSGVMVMTNSNAGVALHPQTVRNCCYIVPDGQSNNIITFDTNVTWTLTWTQNGANALAGHTGNVVYTSRAAAGLDENLRPLIGSPLLLAGNVAASGQRDADNMAIPVGQQVPVGAYAARPVRELVAL